MRANYKNLWPVKPLPVSWFVNELEKGNPFSFTRFGDGETLVFLGDTGWQNCDGCVPTEALQADMRQVLENNYPYKHAALNVARTNLGNRAKDYFEQNRVEVDWYSGDNLLTAALAGRLFPFVDQLRHKRVLMVGQPFLKELPEKGFFRPVYFYCNVPARNAHTRKTVILQTVTDLVDRFEIDVVLWSLGFYANVFVDELWPVMGNEVTHIDCGSMWDGFCGQLSRSYIQRGKVLFDDLTEVNIGARRAKPGETFRRA